MSVTTLQSNEILTIPPQSPERLFSKGALDSCEDEYRLLARKWHPDREHGSADVMAHINLLYNQAKEKISKGLWKTPFLLEFHTTDRHTYRYGRLRYVSSGPTRENVIQVEDK